MYPISSGQGSAPTAQIAQFRSDGFSAQTGLRIQFFSDDFARAFGMPRARLINMISEATPLREERPYVPLVGLRELRYSRPGLTTGYNNGTGPIRGVFLAPPGLGGMPIEISGTGIYNVFTGASLGTLPGTDMARFAASASQMVLVASGNAYLCDATTGGSFAPIVNAVLPPVSDVAYLAGRFVYPASGSNRFYYSEINDAANQTGLDFATNETLADVTVGVASLNDELVFFGTRHIEFWNTAADANAPFQPIEGRGYARGCVAQGSIAYADNSLFWVGENRVVYRSGNTPGRVSSNSIEDALRQCPSIGALTAFTATFEGHEFYVLNVPAIGSFAYDISRIGTTVSTYGDSYARGEWDEWQSWQKPTFRGRCALQLDHGHMLVGDDSTNDLWSMQTGIYTDAGGPMTRQASAFIKIEEGNPRCTALVLHCVTGVGNPVDPGSAPVAEMRYSDDLGRTFGDWRAAPLNPVGVYGPPRAMWQRLGVMRAPGRLVEVRCSDPVNAVYSHLELNPVRPAL
ncbi:MAG: hypothetical protein ACYC8V_06745 [Caulobacteraceae bacterium]